MVGSAFRIAIFTLLAAPAAAQVFTVTTDQSIGGGFVGGVVTQNGAPPRDTPPPTGTSRIRGRLTDAATGTPLRRASVRATAPELRGQRMTTTDANGRFEFAELPGGRYTVTGTKSGFVDMSYGALGPMETGKTITLADKQTVDNINVSLPRGSVITGRVVDEFGEPVADAMVMPMRIQYSPNGRRPMPSGRSSQTNDIGEFRLFGLAPGQYVVSATYRQMNVVNMNGQVSSNTDRSGYATTYYPSTANASEAQTISVRTSELLPEIGIMLVPTRTAVVKGIVLDGTGRPLKEGMVMARQADSFGGFGNSNGQIRPDGSFTLGGLAAGDYVLMAMIPTMGMITNGGGPPEQSIARVTVAGNDLDGVVLAPMQSVELSGRVVVDPAAVAAFRPQMFRFMAQPKNPMDMSFMGQGGGPPQPTKDDFTFTLKALPGDIVVRSMGAPAGWMVRSIRLNGEDITEGFTLRPDERGTLEVEVTNRAPQLSGSVTNRRGEPVTDYFAIFFPEDYERQPGVAFGHYAQARSDQDGRFNVRNLLPGSYYAVAVSRVQQGQSNDPEFLTRVRPSAVRVTLQEGETKTLDLRLIEP